MNISKKLRNIPPLKIPKITIGFYLIAMEIIIVVKEEGLVISYIL